MSTRQDRSLNAAQVSTDDELGPYVDEALKEPTFGAAYEDALDAHRILDSLVALRRALKFSQTTVAERMGVRQPTVSGFETEGSDPRLSTLQRYARAVEARLKVSLEMPCQTDWITPVMVAGESSAAVQAPSEADVKTTELTRDWKNASRRQHWEKVA